jgi:hypothetical protein
MVAGVVMVTFAGPSCAADGITELARETHWGESSDQLLGHFADRASRLPHAVDFGDSYANVALRYQRIGGARMVVFFQMDKLTRGLKRIQLESPRHSVNPPIFRTLLAALMEAYGAPDEDCAIPARSSTGYQAATEARWLRDGTAISMIFRDTTLEAFEGCLFGPASGSCGLRGQLLVRISPIVDAATTLDRCSGSDRRPAGDAAW